MGSHPVREQDVGAVRDCRAEGARDAECVDRPDPRRREDENDARERQAQRAQAARGPRLASPHERSRDDERGIAVVEHDGERGVDPREGREQQAGLHADHAEAEREARQDRAPARPPEGTPGSDEQEQQGAGEREPERKQRQHREVGVVGELREDRGRAEAESRREAQRDPLLLARHPPFSASGSDRHATSPRRMHRTLLDVGGQAGVPVGADEEPSRRISTAAAVATPGNDQTDQLGIRSGDPIGRLAARGGGGRVEARCHELPCTGFPW